MKQDIVVRRMELGDIPAAAAVEKECFSMPWSEKNFAESLSLSYALFYVAEYDGEIAGYIGIYQLGDEFDITNVAVLEKYRRKGIGKTLLEEVERCAVNKNVQSITLEVRESNTPAINLYEVMGYKNIGIRKKFYEKPTENAIIMIREFYV